MDVRKFMTLTMAVRHLDGRISLETLRKKADTGAIHCVRDPVGRRLLLRKDVEALAERLTDGTK